MKVLSKSTEYGIRALLYMISQGGQSRFTGIGEIARSLNLSFYFLTKIFRELTENGILASYRGPNGGITLKKPANEIMLIDIVYILEGKGYFDKCLLGLSGCGHLDPCPVHHFWKAFKDDFKKNLSQTSLADLAHKTTLEKLRLTG